MAADQYQRCDEYEEYGDYPEEYYEVYRPSEAPWWMRKAMPVLVSAAVHLTLFWMAAFIVFSTVVKKKAPPTIVISEEATIPQEFDETADLAMFRRERIEADKIVEMPIVELEEEYEVTKDIPKGISFDCLANKNLGSTSVSDAYGVGGGRAGPYGQRWGKGRLAIYGGSLKSEESVMAALRWLHFHQDRNGQWDQDGFDKNCDHSKGPACDGKGTSQYDVAVSGLALLAFLGNGHTHRVGLFKKTVKRGLDWLVSQQESDGSLGSHLSESWFYNHAISAMALCEAFATTRDYRLKKPAQKAIDYIRTAQNAGLGWKYEPKSGLNDTSVTGWVILALKAAKTAGLAVEQSMFDGAINWFDRVTNPAGKTGYMRPGDNGSVIQGVNEKYAKLPTMTAVALICRIFCGQSRRDPKIVKGVNILMKNLPEFDKPGHNKVDMYYWYYATYAVFQYGGSKWHEWNKAMKNTLIDSQRRTGCAHGSWDPAGKWGMVGGRVYATAINALTLEIYYRYVRAHQEELLTIKK